MGHFPWLCYITRGYQRVKNEEAMGLSKNQWFPITHKRLSCTSELQTTNRWAGTSESKMSAWAPKWPRGFGPEVVAYAMVGCCPGDFYGLQAAFSGPKIGILLGEESRKGFQSWIVILPSDYVYVYKHIVCMYIYIYI